MTQIVIERRYNLDDYEHIATFENGELKGDQDFIESFDYLFEPQYFDPEIILERFSGPTLIASIPEEDEGNNVEQSSKAKNGPNVVSINKYKVYLSEAEDMAEAVEMAPDWANVQEGTQGGYFYMTEDDPSAGEDDEEDTSEEPEGILDNDIGNETGFQVDESVNPEDIQAGDKVYVTHPANDELPYIAEVDSVDTGGGSWAINFGGGSYTLREQTNSEYAGLVEEEPELGDDEELGAVYGVGDVEAGDHIAYTDPAGYTHYPEVLDTVEEQDMPQLNEDKILIEAYETSDGEGNKLVDPDTVDGIVKTEDPTGQYDVPTAEEVEENTNIDNAEAAADFANNIAKLVSEGEGTDMSSRKCQFNIGAVQDKDLVIDYYRQVITNDGSATARKALEKRMRGMDLDPDEYHPENLDYNPDEVPQERKGTVYDSFESERAVDTVSMSVHRGNFSKSNEQEWHEFMDTMTDPELAEAAIKTLTHDYGNTGVIHGSDPIDFEGKDLQSTEEDPSLIESRLNNISSVLTRYGEGEPEKQRQLYNDMMDAVETTSLDTTEVGKVAATWFEDPEVRREAYEDHEANISQYNNGRFVIQFSDDHDERAEAIIDRYTAGTKSLDTKFVRAALYNHDTNGGKTSRFNHGQVVDGVTMTPEMKETVDRMIERTGNHIEEEHDGEITLRRGIDHAYTSNAAAESWADPGSEFSRKYTLEATFEPGEIIACHEIDDYGDYGYTSYGEDEWTVLGGPLAEEIPDAMTVPDVYGVQ